MSACGYFASGWPSELASPLTVPRAPLQIHMCYFVQAITPAGSDINESQLKNMSQDGMSGMPRTRCLYGRTLYAGSLSCDAQWRMRESTARARRTDALEAEWVCCCLSAFIPSHPFMQVEVRCHTLPQSVAGDAAHRRGWRIVVRMNELRRCRSDETGLRFVLR